MSTDKPSIKWWTPKAGTRQWENSQKNVTGTIGRMTNGGFYIIVAYHGEPPKVHPRYLHNCETMREAIEAANELLEKVLTENDCRL